MKTFEELFHLQTYCIDQHEMIRSKFRELVVRAGFVIWDGINIPPGKWIIIGIATYSGDEMKLLDSFTGNSSVGIYILDVTTLNDMAKSMKVFRSPTPILGTPVLLKGSGDVIEFGPIYGFVAREEMKAMIEIWRRT
jgi:hypothetical protein